MQSRKSSGYNYVFQQHDLCQQISHKIQQASSINKNKASIFKLNSTSKAPTFDIKSPENINFLAMYDTICKLQKYHKDIVSAWNNNIIEYPNSLEWAKNLYLPIALALSESDKVDSLTSEEVFEKACKTPSDIDTCALLALKCNPEATLVDAHVSAKLLQWNTQGQHKYLLQDYQKHLKSWQDRRLTFPLIIAAKFMPLSKDWGISESKDAPARVQDFLDAVNSANNHSDITKVLASIPHDNMMMYLTEFLGLQWKAQKKGPLNTSFVEFIAKFTKFLANDVPKTWVLPEIMGLNTTTIGFSKLQWTTTNHKLEITSEQPLQVISTSASRKRAPCVFQNNAILKTAQLLLTTEISAIVQYPNEICRCISENNPEYMPLNAEFSSPVDNLIHLQNMSSEKIWDITKCVQVAKKGIEAHMTQEVITLPEPITIVASTIELPPKAMSYSHNTRIKLHNLAHPHNISRKKCTCKSALQQVTHIGILNQKEDSIRAMVCSALLQHYAHGLSIIEEPEEKCLHSALHETLACMVFHEPVLHNVISLNEKVEWHHSYADNRYAETQIAAGHSGRYRDWVSFFPKNSIGAYWGKLDSHVVGKDSFYQTYCPLISSSQQDVPSVVKVVSSKQFTPQVLCIQSDTDTAATVETTCTTKKRQLLYQLKNLIKSKPHILHTDENSNIKSNDIKAYIHDGTLYKCAPQNMEKFQTDNPAPQLCLVYSTKDDPSKTLDVILFEIV